MGTGWIVKGWHNGRNKTSPAQNRDSQATLPLRRWQHGTATLGRQIADVRSFVAIRGQRNVCDQFAAEIAEGLIGLRRLLSIAAWLDQPIEIRQVRIFVCHDSSP